MGLDRFTVPHELGSSHGETRITRQAVGEGAAYVPLVASSHRIWREIEAETGEELLRTTGNLIIASGSGASSHHGKPEFVRRSAEIARHHGITHEMLDGSAMRRRFPHFIGIRDGDIGYYEPGAGYLRPERCIAAQLALARRHGAAILPPDEVLTISQQCAGVTARTASGLTIRADQIVVAAGPWTGPLLGGEFAARLQVLRQVLHWFELAEEATIGEDAPTFIWMHGHREEDYLYGFPPLPGQRSIKVATEQYTQPTTAEEVAREDASQEAEGMFRAHVAGRIAGVTSSAVRSAACLYTVTPDRGFIIDRHPQHDRIFVVSACSGHGFKHSAGIGAAVAETIVEGRSQVDLSPFGLSRFQEPRPDPVRGRLAPA